MLTFSSDSLLEQQTSAPGIAAGALIEIFRDVRDVERLGEYLTTHGVPPNYQKFRWRQSQQSDCDGTLVHLHLGAISRSKVAN
jgi:hypothetical protein